MAASSPARAARATCATPVNQAFRGSARQVPGVLLEEMSESSREKLGVTCLHLVCAPNGCWRLLAGPGRLLSVHLHWKKVKRSYRQNVFFNQHSLFYLDSSEAWVKGDFQKPCAKHRFHRKCWL